MNRLAHRGYYTGRIAARSHYEVNRKIVFQLRIRHIPHSTIEAVIGEILFHVFDDGDYRHPREILTRADPLDSFSERIFPRPSLTRQLFADHDDRRLAGLIGLID